MAAAAARRSLTTTLAAIGAPVVRAAQAAVDVGALLGYALPATVRGVRRPAVRAVLVRQILFTGVEAVPLALLVALAAATGLAVLSGILGGVSLAGDFLVVLVLREIGPLGAAVIVVARSGTAMAAELGAMRVLREVEGLEGMGVDPLEYLVAPRMVGAAVALAALTVFVVAGTIVAAAAVSAWRAGADMGDELWASLRAIGGLDLLSLLAKAGLPGGAFAAVACREGLSVTSATDVPRAVRRAAVGGLVAALAWNVLVTALLPSR